MFIVQRALATAVLAVAGIALTGCAQTYQQGSRPGVYPTAKRQPARNPGYIDQKATRQVNRQEQRVNNRIDWETDRAVDRGINKVLSDILN